MGFNRGKMQVEALTPSNMATQKEWNMIVPDCGRANKRSSVVKYYYYLFIMSLNSNNSNKSTN